MSEREETRQPEHSNDGGPAAQGLTRRQWILRLGEAAVLAGFSAASEALVVPESQTLATVPSNGSSALPPGLYDPSGEHMAHVLLRDERFVTPPAGSETEYAVAHATGFEPAFFSAEDYKVARRLVELVLNAPADAAAAPGVVAVGGETLDEIAEWMDLVLSQAAATREAAKKMSDQHRELAIHYHGEEAVRRLETADPEKTWKDGLAWLDQESRKLSGQGFLNLTEARQYQLLNSVSDSKGNGDEGSAQRTENSGSRLYRLLKTEAIRGYYTSRSGLKELDYQGNAFHAESPGCPTK